MSTKSTTTTSTDSTEHDGKEKRDAEPWMVPVNRDEEGAVIGIGLFVSEDELRVMGIDPDKSSEVIAVARPYGLEVRVTDSETRRRSENNVKTRGDLSG